MSKLLQDVIDRVQRWPEDRQDDAARVLLDFEAQQGNAYRLSPEQVQEVERIQRQVRDGTARFASDEQMDSFWRTAGCS